MPFTFNGAAQTITWSGGPLSVREMWSRYIDWLAVGDNSKYTPMLDTVGMLTTDIPLYVFLENGVIIIITDNTVPTAVNDGVLKTRDGHDPFGGAVVNVRYEAPGIAIGYSTSGSTGPSAADIADALLAAAQAAGGMPSRVVAIHNTTLAGAGTPADPMRPA